MAAQTYPVTLTGELTVPPARGWWLLKWLLALPHYIILAFLWMAKKAMSHTIMNATQRNTRTM